MQQADASNKNVLYLPVRVHGYIIDYASGRVKFDTTLLNDSIVEKKYTPTFGLHVDVGGQHTHSKLYSNGTDGLYFNEEKTVNDSLSARLFFYLNTENGPTSMKTGDLTTNPYPSGNFKYVYGWWNMKKQNWTNTTTDFSNVNSPWDSVTSKGALFDLSHPIFAYKWDSLSVQAGDTGSFSLEMSITEPDEDDDPTKPLDPVESQLVHKVTHADGSEAKIVNPEEVLNFSGELKPPKVSGTGSPIPYLALTFESFVDSKITNVNSIKLQDSTGKIVGTGKYNASKNQILASISDITLADKSIFLTYQGTVKEDAALGSTISSFFKVNGTNAAGAEIPNIVSNIVQMKVGDSMEDKPLIHKVTHVDGTEAKVAESGEILKFSGELKPQVVESGEPYPYMSLNFEGTVDPNITDITAINVKDSKGTVIGTGKYDAGSNKVIVEIVDLVQSNQSIFLTYEGTVKKDVAPETLLTSFISVKAVDVFGTELPTLVSNKVTIKVEANSLELLSAPKTISFGTNHLISAKEESYALTTKDNDIVVQDNRSKRNNWRITAILTKDFSTTDNKKLSSHLVYKNGEELKEITTENESTIVEQSSGLGEKVAVSSNWNKTAGDTNEGLYLVVLPGGALAQTYTNTLRWSLQDVPANKEP